LFGFVVLGLRKTIRFDFWWVGDSGF